MAFVMTKPIRQIAYTMEVIAVVHASILTTVQIVLASMSTTKSVVVFILLINVLIVHKEMVLVGVMGNAYG